MQIGGPATFGQQAGKAGQKDPLAIPITMGKNNANKAGGVNVAATFGEGKKTAAGGVNGTPQNPFAANTAGLQQNNPGLTVADASRETKPSGSETNPSSSPGINEAAEGLKGTLQQMDKALGEGKQKPDNRHPMAPKSFSPDERIAQKSTEIGIG